MKAAGMSRNHRIAAIDVGTNSIHMIIVEALTRGFRVIDREKEMVQLGRGSLEGKPLTAAAMRRGIEALTRMAQIARRHAVEEIICVATSATREAPNGEEFAREAERASGVRVRVIGGEEEADYIWQAVRASVDFHGGSIVCVDVGGGSMELIVGDEAQVHFARSSRLGSLRLTQQFFGSENVDADAVSRCRYHIRRALQSSMARIRSLGFDQIVGTSGTIVTLGKLSAGSGEIAAGLLRLERSGLRTTLERLASLDVSRRAEELDLDPRRAETILAGALLLDEVLTMAGAESMLVSTAALREGIVHSALRSRRGESVPRETIRRSAVLDLAERSGVQIDRVQYVERLALGLYDQLVPVHGLGSDEREMLAYAALLHTIGQQVSWERYHKHSYYMIRHAGLQGFTEEQVRIVANAARYHRKALPSDEHENFSELSDPEKRTVQVLAGILRAAYALQRSAHQAFTGISADCSDDRIELELHPSLPPNEKMPGVAKSVRRLGEALGRPVTLRETTPAIA